VRGKYREVAEDPDGDYHFHTGRAHAIRRKFGTYGYSVRARKPFG
jgi:hypothetical protein